MTQAVLMESNGKELLPQRPITPLQIIAQLMENPNCDPSKLGELLDVQLRWEANEARKAYHLAKAEFQRNAPAILKTKEVRYKEVAYKHAELDKMVEVLTPEMAKYGLSYSWRPEPSENGKIRVSCVVTYSHNGLAHSEVGATLEAPPDATGSKNAVQAIGSSNYYLQRYTFAAAFGLVPKNSDDDGRSSEGLAQQVVDEYLTSIRDASSLTELQQRYEAAKAAGSAKVDADAVLQFIAAKDERVKQIRAAQPAVRR